MAQICGDLALVVRLDTVRGVIPPFVSIDWVRKNRALVVLADVRFYLDGRAGRDGFETGHIHGAVYVEMDGILAAHGSPAEGRHPLPTPEAFAAGLSEAGIGDDSTVVAYDDAGGVIAARLVWMLRALGHDAALLDGGLAGWPEAPVTDAATPEPAVFTAKPWPTDALATIEDAQDPGNVVIDARPRDRFDGAPDAVDPRFGHIPGAKSLPCREHVEGGFLKPDSDLLRAVSEVGADGGAPVVSYCGSGVTACHNLLVLEHLGVTGARLYPGSWSQYAHTDLPVETA